MTAFLDRIELAIHDGNLQTVLDSTTSRLRQKRAHGFSSLAHAETVRNDARAAKMDALRNLHEHLITFEANLQRNGVNVHWAVDAKEANRIAAEIAREKDIEKIVKSKSMVTEEIHLNRALERHGLHVRETDLGEYIVQLAHDQPSHIVMPIIHMKRADIGRLMQKRMGAAYTDDPQELAAIARKTLRQEFLQADMGITGANFGVAETGTICIVTNEGNARMVTTLPRIHVVIMGIEKLLPTLADLDNMLKLLARSATGQKLTVYTSLFHGPRQNGETDGPEEMHVILLDNGRTRALQGDVAEILGCIRCGACLNACPIFTTIGGHAYGDTYPGPIGEVVTPAIRGLEQWHELPSASTLCGACKEVCPLYLDIPGMLLKLRRQAAKQKPRLLLKIAMKMFAFITVRPRLYRAKTRFARIIQSLFSKDGWLKKAPPLLRGWTRHRDMREMPKQTFQQQWQNSVDAKKSR